MINMLTLMHTVRKKVTGEVSVSLTTTDVHDQDIAGTLRIESAIEGQRYQMWADLTFSQLKETRLNTRQYGTYLAETFNRDLREHLQATE